MDFYMTEDCPSIIPLVTFAVETLRISQINTHFFSPPTHPHIKQHNYYVSIRQTENPNLWLSLPTSLLFHCVCSVLEYQKQCLKEERRTDLELRRNRLRTFLQEQTNRLEAELRDMVSNMATRKGRHQQKLQERNLARRDRTGKVGHFPVTCSQVLAAECLEAQFLLLNFVPLLTSLASAGRARGIWRGRRWSTAGAAAWQGTGKMTSSQLATPPPPQPPPRRRSRVEDVEWTSST